MRVHSFLLFTAVLLTSCSHSSSSSPATPPLRGNGKKEALDNERTKATEQKVKDGTLNEKYFTLKSDLDFSAGIAHSYNLPDGSKTPTVMTRHSFPHHNQQLLTTEQEEAAPSYCNIFVETTEGVRVSDMVVKARAGMVGQNLMIAAYNDEVGVTIGFSLGVFQQLTLFCHNVFTKEDLEREIGNLISVTDRP